jgi:ribosomal protein S17
MAKTKFIGKVAKVYADGKTVSLISQRTEREKIYGKVIKSTKKLIADCNVKVDIGDQVEVVEISPVSKRKTWKVINVAK